MGDLVEQIAAFVVASGLLGLLFGILIGRTTQRGRVDRGPASGSSTTGPGRRRSLAGPDLPVHERVVVRPDLTLYRENERLRDRLVTLRARLDALEADLSVRTDGTATRAAVLPHEAEGDVVAGSVTDAPLVDPSTPTGANAGPAPRHLAPRGEHPSGFQRALRWRQRARA